MSQHARNLHHAASIVTTHEEMLPDVTVVSQHPPDVFASSRSFLSKTFREQKTVPVFVGTVVLGSEPQVINTSEN
jgi:hypothetical protein